jgi:hypothetical protein
MDERRDREGAGEGLGLAIENDIHANIVVGIISSVDLAWPHLSIDTDDTNFQYCRLQVRFP